MADVFISYAREDRARAEQVARGLGAMGLDVFWDTDIPPGKTWADYIEDKLSQSKAMIVLWSVHSAGSQWVREEARMGRDSGKLIPAMLDATPAPFGFGEVQAADLSAWRGEANNPNWIRFANAVDGAVRGPNAAPRPVLQAPPMAPPSFASASAAGAEALTPPGYVMKCLRLYLDAKGRARRAEYWWWAAFALVVSLVAMMLDLGIFGLNSYTGRPNMQIFSLIVGLALLSPGVCVTVRRFHDVGLNGWLVAGAFAAFALGAALSATPIGAIVILASAAAVLVVTVLPSKPGANAYGPNPKGQ